MSRAARLATPRSFRPIAFGGSATMRRSGLAKAVTTLALAIAIGNGIGCEAVAQTTYYTTTGSTVAWNTSRWSTSSSGPFTGSFVSSTNSAVAFTSGSYQFAGMGTTTNVGTVTVSNNVNVFFASAGSTYATGGAVQTIDVGTGAVYDLGSQTVSTAAGTGFLKTGAGVFATVGSSYPGGFTLNAGTVIVRGVNAMGAGGALTLNGGVVAGNANRSLTGKYTGGITVGGNVQFGEFASNVALANDTANLTFDNTMALGAAHRTLTLGNKGIMAFAGVISNSSGGITFAAASGADASVSGAGRFDVTNLANTFTGNLTFTGAEVRFSGDGSLGNAANEIIINGGRFAIASGSNVALGASRDIQVGDTAGTSISVPGASGTLTYNNAITDISGKTGSWTKEGSGVLRLGGVSTYTGSTTIASGTMQFTTGNDRLPAGTVLSLGQAASTSRGTLDLGGFNQTVGGLATIVGSSTSVSNIVTTSVGSGTLAINVASGTSAYGDGSDTNSGVISGAVSVVKLGAGTQILGGSNAYTGVTTLSAGTLRSGTGTVGNFAFGSGTLALNGGTLTSGTDNQARTFANAITVGGNVAFGDATATGGLTFSGSADFGGSNRTLTTVQMTTFSGPISNGGLVKAGTATLTLGGSNSYSGATTVNAGILALGASDCLSNSTAVTIAGGGLNLSTFTDTVSSFTITSGSLFGSGTVTASNYDLGGGVTAGNLGVGTLTVTADSTLSGAAAATIVNLNAGTLTLSSGGRLASTAAMSGSSGATLSLGGNETIGSLSGSAHVSLGGNLTVGDATSTSYAGSFSGAASLVKVGSGTLSLTGDSSGFTGPTTVSAGTLRVNGVLGSGSLSVAAAAWLMGTGTINGPVTVNGTLAPGSSPGVITLGSLTLTDTSTTVIEVASAGTRGTAYDGVSILDPSGLTYGGTLSIAFGGSAIADETTFDIFSFTGPSAGSLAAVESTGFYAGTWTPLGSGTFQLLSGTQTLTFSQSTGDVIVVPEPAALALAVAGLAALGCGLRRRFAT